jgi:hypothetical protein
VLVLIAGENVAHVDLGHASAASLVVAASSQVVAASSQVAAASPQVAAASSQVAAASSQVTAVSKATPGEPPTQGQQQQLKSLTDALNDIIPDVFDNLDTQPAIDHELIHSDLFRTAESLISSTIFSMCIDSFASEINR